jgi:hypothetical protein
MNHAKRNPGIPKRPNPQKNAKVVLALSVRTIESSARGFVVTVDDLYRGDHRSSIPRSARRRYTQAIRSVPETSLKRGSTNLRRNNSGASTAGTGSP